MAVITVVSAKPTKEGAPCVEMTCECGWQETTYADQSGVVMCENHILTKHQRGEIQFFVDELWEARKLVSRMYIGY